MKALITALTLTVSLAAVAGTHEKWNQKIDKMSFSDAKSMLQENARMRTTMLETYSSCVNGAKDKTALMQCKEYKSEDHKAMKRGMRSEKQSMEDASEEEK